MKARMAAGRLPGPLGVKDWNPWPGEDHKRPVDLFRTNWPLSTNVASGPGQSLHFEAAQHRPIATGGGRHRSAGHAPANQPASPSDIDHDKLYRDIVRWEGVVMHMYLDTHHPPLVTVGTGNMLPDVAAAQALPFVNRATHKPATKAEIATAFHAVASMPGSLAAAKYKQNPSIEITERTAKELAIARLRKEFIPGIKQMFPGFDTFPLPAREALIDIAYNAGVGREEKVVSGKTHKASGLHAFKHLRHAVEAGDWLAAARSCNRSSSREARNRWARELFEEAARIAGHKPI